MKRSLVAFLTVGVLVVGWAAAQAQSKPDFSGTWVMDRDRSDPPNMGPGGPGGPGGGGAGGAGGPGGPGGPGGGNLTIVQGKADLKIEREGRDGAVTSSYALDGTESKNPGMRGGESRSKTHWDGDALVTEGQQTMDTPNGAVTMDFKDVRRLSDGGKTMTVESTRTSPRGTTTRKVVYTKKAQ
jgi:hypothetical protein